MGGQQTYEWAVRYPDAVARAGIFAATATVRDHNHVILDVISELLTSDPAFAEGRYGSSDDVYLGLKRHAVAFSLVGMSPDVYRDEVWRESGFGSADDIRRSFVRGCFLPMDPNNLLSQVARWKRSDVSPHGGRDLTADMTTRA